MTVSYCYSTFIMAVSYYYSTFIYHLCTEKPINIRKLYNLFAVWLAPTTWLELK